MIVGYLINKFRGDVTLFDDGIAAIEKFTGWRCFGVVPWLKTLDSSVAAVNQGGKRKGACAVYLEPWHADVEEFLELRDNSGDAQRRTHNLNLANWVPDLFMQRVEADGEGFNCHDYFMTNPSLSGRGGALAESRVPNQGGSVRCTAMGRAGHHGDHTGVGRRRHAHTDRCALGNASRSGAQSCTSGV